MHACRYGGWGSAICRILSYVIVLDHLNMVVAILYIESKDYSLMNPDWLSHTKHCVAELALIAELTQLSQMQQAGAHSGFEDVPCT